MRLNSEFGIRNSEFHPSSPWISARGGAIQNSECRFHGSESPAAHPAPVPLAGGEEGRPLNSWPLTHVGALPRVGGRHSEFRIPNSEFEQVGVPK